MGRLDALRSARHALLAAGAVMLGIFALSSCATAEQRAEAIAYAKCGPDGTVDWDPNPDDPPPHCNRDGWDGRQYQDAAEIDNGH